LDIAFTGAFFTSGRAESLNNNGNLTNDYIARTRKGETKLDVSTTDKGKNVSF